MSNSTNESFFGKAYNPVLQAAITLGFAVFMMIMGKIVNGLGIMEVGERFPWMCSAALMLCFAVFNSVFSLSAPRLSKYWGKSIYCFIGLAAGAGLFAYAFSSLSINQAGSYKWIYFVVAIGYLVFLSMMGFMKKVVEFAQKEEWNHPRLRRKGGKSRNDER